MDYSDAWLRAEKAMKIALAEAALHDWAAADVHALQAQGHIADFRASLRALQATQNVQRGS